MQKITRNNRKEHNKIAILTRSKLNGIESIISKVLIDHEDLTTNINDERNYFQLKESIRMMKSHRSDTVKKIWLKKAKELVLVKLLNILTLTIIIYISSIKQCYHIVWGVTHKSKTLFQMLIRRLYLEPFSPNLDVNVYFWRKQSFFRNKYSYC